MHDGIPAEVISHILYFIEAEENLRSVQCVSRRLHKLANEPLLWRYHCRTDFRFWEADHQLAWKLRAKVAAVDWKQLWMLRRSRNKRAARLLDGILASPLGRVRKFEQLCPLGFDVKDYLLEQCNADDSVEDVLARRYYAKVALGSIHRGVAIKEWARNLDPGDSKPLDRALGGFDMFILRGDEGLDLDGIETTLDNYSRQFLEAHPDFAGLATRQKALALVRWLRSQNLVGMADPATNYRHIRNALIGHALASSDHPSLPLISSAIFSSIGQRLGLRAQCCAVPNHVHATVFAPYGETLDGQPTTASSGPPDHPNGPPLATYSLPLDTMHLDPYEKDEEVPVEQIRQRLAQEGRPWDNSYLGASPTSLLVVRTAHNIRATHNFFIQAPNMVDAGALGGDPDHNMESLVYATFWVRGLLLPVRRVEWGQNLSSLLGSFHGTFPEDIWLVRRHLISLYDIHIADRFRRGVYDDPNSSMIWENLHMAVRETEERDVRMPPVARRDTQQIRDNVTLRVGDVITHKRYGYYGVITGWTNDGHRGELPHMWDAINGRHGHRNNDNDLDERSSYALESPMLYTCLKAKKSRLVLLPESLALVKDPGLVSEELKEAAGKYFKRFDRDTCTFVSNIKEFFPDD